MGRGGMDAMRWAMRDPPCHTQRLSHPRKAPEETWIGVWNQRGLGFRPIMKPLPCQ